MAKIGITKLANSTKCLIHLGVRSATTTKMGYQTKLIVCMDFVVFYETIQ